MCSQLIAGLIFQEFDILHSNSHLHIETSWRISFLCLTFLKVGCVLIECCVGFAFLSAARTRRQNIYHQRQPIKILNSKTRFSILSYFIRSLKWAVGIDYEYLVRFFVGYVWLKRHAATCCGYTPGLYVCVASASVYLICRESGNNTLTTTTRSTHSYLDGVVLLKPLCEATAHLSRSHIGRDRIRSLGLKHDCW